MRPAAQIRACRDLKSRREGCAIDLGGSPRAKGLLQRRVWGLELLCETHPDHARLVDAGVALPADERVAFGIAVLVGTLVERIVQEQLERIRLAVVRCREVGKPIRRL